MLYPVLAENDYLAGANIRLKGRADRVERAGLRCDNIASVGQSAVAERAEAGIGTSEVCSLTNFR